MSKLFQFLIGPTISTLIRSRKVRFLYKLVNSQKELCELASVAAHEEINIISYS